MIEFGQQQRLMLIGSPPFADVDKGQDDAVNGVVDGAIGPDAQDIGGVGRLEGDLALDDGEVAQHFRHILGDVVIGE